jgi:hypothetical protein
MSWHSLRPLQLLLISLASAALPWAGVLAQRAEIPRADPRGDFFSILIQGQRDPYPQRQWLVVARDPDGLNCRDGRGRVLAVLAYGSVVDSDLSGTAGNAIVLVAGRPWLRLIVDPFDLQRDLRPPAQRNRALNCQVRANMTYVAPLNPDTLAPAGKASGG